MKKKRNKKKQYQKETYELKTKRYVILLLCGLLIGYSIVDIILMLKGISSAGLGVFIIGNYGALSVWALNKRKNKDD